MDNKGFSLVSVLVAIVVLAIGLLTILNATTRSVGEITAARHRVTATNLASSHMEYLVRQDSIVAESSVNIDSDGIIDVTGVYVRTVFVSRDSLKARVVVRIDYPTSFGNVKSLRIAAIRRDS